MLGRSTSGRLVESRHQPRRIAVVQAGAEIPIWNKLLARRDLEVKVEEFSNDRWNASAGCVAFVGRGESIRVLGKFHSP